MSLIRWNSLQLMDCDFLATPKRIEQNRWEDPNMFKIRENQPSFNIFNTQIQVVCWSQTGLVDTCVGTSCAWFKFHIIFFQRQVKQNQQKKRSCPRVFPNPVKYLSWFKARIFDANEIIISSFQLPRSFTKFRQGTVNTCTHIEYSSCQHGHSPTLWWWERSAETCASWHWCCLEIWWIIWVHFRFGVS